MESDVDAPHTEVAIEVVFKGEGMQIQLVWRA